MASTLSDVYDVAVAFLAASWDALELTDLGAPDRAYVSPGEPAMDCCTGRGELAVWTPSLADADTIGPSSTAFGALAPGKKVQRGNTLLLTVMVQIIRCVPTLKDEGASVVLPPAIDLLAAGRMVEEDLWALWTHLSAELRDGTLAKVCSGAWRDGAQALPQQGGCGGWQLTFRYPIEGGRIGT